MTTLLLWNLVLALAWAALTGRFTPENLGFGLALGYLILWFAQRVMGPSLYFQKVRQVVGFLGFYLWELVLANLRLAYDIATPGHLQRPGIVAVPLDVRSDVEITLLANLITLTPGTLSVDVSTDRKVLYIHAMYIDDLEEFRRTIKEGYERRVLEVSR